MDDTEKALMEDKQFLGGLEKNCAEKEADWEYRSKMRADEIVAISETIKILNDDDALELFKKTLPSPALLQTAVGQKQMRARALQVLQNLRHKQGGRFDAILLAIEGKKVSFA